MANFAYNEGVSQLLSGSINWSSDTIKCRLIASTATPNKDDTSLASGYTAIGTDQTLASKSRTKDNTNDRVVYDAADPTFTAVASGSTIGWAIVYKDDGGNGVPIAALDVVNTATTGGNATITFDTAGIFYFQQ